MIEVNYESILSIVLPKIITVMRKVMFLLLSMFAFVSCEQEELLSELQVPDNKKETPVTRGVSDIPDALSQLNGIPVNIKSVANGKYLSAKSSGDGIYLAPNDDGSLRQRWNIAITFATNITLIGGNSTYPNGRFEFNKKGDSYFPQLMDSNMPLTVGRGFKKTEDGITYNIMLTEFFEFPVKFWYLQPKSTGSNELVVGDSNYKGDLVKWDIIPVDNFRVEEITYDLTTDDNLSVIPTQIANKTLVNDTDVPATRTLSFQETVTNESSFSELMGLKITDKISATHKFGIAKFLNGEYTMETTSEQTWNYTVGNKETQSYTISETVTQEIPPRTTIEAKLMATKYSATMTYVAKLYGINCGKTIYLKGKWNGAIVQESKIVLTQKGKVLKTIELDK